MGSRGGSRERRWTLREMRRWMGQTLTKCGRTLMIVVKLQDTIRGTRIWMSRCSGCEAQGGFKHVSYVSYVNLRLSSPLNLRAYFQLPTFPRPDLTQLSIHVVPRAYHSASPTISPSTAHLKVQGSPYLSH